MNAARTPLVVFSVVFLKTINAHVSAQELSNPRACDRRTGYDRALPVGLTGPCADPKDCDDGIDCTTDTCESTEGGDRFCLNSPDDSLCDDGIDCTTDTCVIASQGCSNTIEDHDGDGEDDCIDDCPNDPQHGAGTDPRLCIDVRMRAVILSKPSGLDAADGEAMLPMSDDSPLEDGCFVVELWAQDTSTSGCGLACVFADLRWSETCTLTATGIEYAYAFDQFREGEIENETTQVTFFGACSLTTDEDGTGVGIFPRWHRVATVAFQTLESPCTNTLILDEGSDPPSIIPGCCCPPVTTYCEGGGDWLDCPTSHYDIQNVATRCRGEIYNLSLSDESDENQITPGDFSILATCWMADGELGECVDADWDCDGIVGPGDLAFFANAWLKDVCAPDIVVPACQLRCGDGQAGLPWADDQMIRDFRLPVPTVRWSGWASNQRGRVPSRK